MYGYFSHKNNFYVTYLGGNDYRILGYVDAQNNFGAIIRNDFIVTLTLTPGGYKNGYVSFY